MATSEGQLVPSVEERAGTVQAALTGQTTRSDNAQQTDLPSVYPLVSRHDAQTATTVSPWDFLETDAGRHPLGKNARASLPGVAHMAFYHHDELIVVHAGGWNCTLASMGTAPF
eukprot:2129443-Pleurochrysis_carterae.AAC.1